MPDQADNGVGRFLLRVDDVVYAHFLVGEDVVIHGQLGVADAGDDGGHAQLFGDAAGVEIDLVVVGHRGEDVLLGQARLLEGLIAGRGSFDHDGVQLLAGPLDYRGGVFDNGDVVFFTGQAFGQPEPNIARAEYENLHGSFAPFRRV